MSDEIEHQRQPLLRDTAKTSHGKLIVWSKINFPELPYESRTRIAQTWMAIESLFRKPKKGVINRRGGWRKKNANGSAAHRCTLTRPSSTPTSPLHHPSLHSCPPPSTLHSFPRPLLIYRHYRYRKIICCPVWLETLGSLTDKRETNKVISYGLLASLFLRYVSSIWEAWGLLENVRLQCSSGYQGGE